MSNFPTFTFCSVIFTVDDIARENLKALKLRELIIRKLDIILPAVNKRELPLIRIVTLMKFSFELDSITQFCRL